MPLNPPPAERELLHLRDIQLRGYRRTDGRFDIEARLTDTKTYGFPNEDRTWIGPGEPLHGMWTRMTVDEDMVIVAFEAAMDHTPYAICPGVAPNFARLAGLRIGPGFLREAAKRVGGIEGCTHLRELLQPMATVAFQTLAPLRMRQREEARGAGDAEAPPALLNTCHAYAETSPVAKRRWPDFLARRSEGRTA